MKIRTSNSQIATEEPIFSLPPVISSPQCPKSFKDGSNLSESCLITYAEKAFLSTKINLTPPLIFVPNKLIVALPTTGNCQNDLINKYSKAFTNIKKDSRENIVSFSLTTPKTEVGVGARCFVAVNISGNLEEALKQIQQGLLAAGFTKELLKIEPEAIYRLAELTPNDQFISQQWSLRNIGWYNIWKIKPAPITVAVIDGGVDINNKDLESSIWINSKEIPDNGIDDDHNGYVDDVHGWNFILNSNKSEAIDHGTHVAGIIGAKINNVFGIAGINSAVKIMTLNVAGTNGEVRLSSILSALTYAIYNGAKVINMSLVGPFKSDNLKDLIDLAYKNKVMIIAAAGNDGRDDDRSPIYPASYIAPNIITVAAINKDNQLSGFSNFGLTTVHIAAPGDKILSTISNNLFGYLSGTSQATPMVTAAVSSFYALNPQSTVEEIKQAVLDSVDKDSNLAKKVSSGGRLNVAKLLAKAITPAITYTIKSTPVVVTVMTNQPKKVYGLIEGGKKLKLTSAPATPSFWELILRKFLSFFYRGLAP